MAPLFQQPFMSGGFPSMNRAAGVVGGWVELARTTLGGAGSTIDVSSLPDKRYYMVLTYGTDSSGGGTTLTLNADTGSNYAWRRSENGGADGTGTSQTYIVNDGGGTTPRFFVDYIANYDTKEKLTIHNMVGQNTAAATNAPTRAEIVGKHAQTSNPIDQITQTASGNWSSGDEMVVLGWDPADTHTTNFWEELGSGSWSSGDAFDSGTFTAKKYLWIQCWYTSSWSAGGFVRYLFGNTTLDTGSNYATRYSIDGGSDGTQTSTANGLFADQGSSGNVDRGYSNIFMINNSSNEKLIMVHNIWSTTDGAAKAPSRSEIVGKWVNTSNQCNIVGIDGTGMTGDFTAGTIKVWGAD